MLLLMLSTLHMLRADLRSGANRELGSSVIRHRCNDLLDHCRACRKIEANMARTVRPELQTWAQFDPTRLKEFKRPITVTKHRTIDPCEYVALGI